MISRTYKIAKSPEAPLLWNEYRTIIENEWDVLLNKESPTEDEVQNFLEQYPCMIPGAFGLIGNPSGHYPSYHGVISQSPLPSYNSRVPDFIWLSQNSDTVQPVLIEIEAPSKRWFTHSGQQTAQLTQALNQISDWKAWFNVSHNIDAFKAFYGLDRDAWQNRRFRPAYLLIFGRRAEANANPLLIGKRGQLFPEDVVGMTYDRLRPNPEADQLVCLKPQRSGDFRVISVPATLKWSPLMAEERAKINKGWENAINSNAQISLSRKEFLIRRRPYWDMWARNDLKGFRNTNDEE